MKRSIAEMAVQLVNMGYKFRIDLPNRNLWINGKAIIKNGQHKYKRTLCTFDFSNVYETLEHLYDRYKHSRPSERSESIKRYFKALPPDQIDDEDMFYGESREVAQLNLELYLLCALIQNLLPWESGKFFWQSQKDRDFVILHNMIAIQ